ncbi:MAG TPA: F0F1 ATP synthase subunit B [Phycisphaerales bacterium]|nr:F0F1 ATP synthase subunit B [Phycisphaerales bacterium]
MKKLPLTVPALLAPAAPALAHAPTSGVIPDLAQVTSAVTALLVFLVVLGILWVAVWPKIVKGLKDREEKIRTEIEAAEMAQQQARAALQQYEKNLADARAEAQRMLEQTKAQQQAIAADLRQKADAELAQLRDRARRDIESAKRAALAEIYEQAATLATDVAAKILRREIGPGDQARLVRESLGELESVGRS